MDELLVDELADCLMQNVLEVIEALVYQDKPLLETILIPYVRRSEIDRKGIVTIQSDTSKDN